jgi:hypothetical protein
LGAARAGVFGDAAAETDRGEEVRGKALSVMRYH